ncbi:MAG: hypothetical protein IJB79_02815 [Candidatus Gastranaerophilales bacterium]|nr:hypothetical protein [Candidatus Gastranaerophilales bacterium]
MNISKITQPIAKFMPKAGEAVNGNSKVAKTFSKGLKLFEPNGADNSFFGLATIMSCFVVIPRIKSALKRNPENKEATMDEIKEILFRDLQTIAIILFGLKSMNALVSNLATKITKIPMVKNPYKKVFAKDAGDFVQRGKNFLSNIVSTISPLSKATRSMGSEDVEKLYMNHPNRDSVIKLLNSIEKKGGEKEAVFEKITKSAIDSMDNKIAFQRKMGQYENGVLSTQGEIDKLAAKKDFFKNLTLERFMSEEALDEDCTKELLSALSDKETNALAKSVNGLNSYLKTAALGVEVGYLGFGLPALNQKRLEKKYLGEKPIGEQRGDTFSPVNDRLVKAQEIKLYSNFMK